MKEEIHSFRLVPLSLQTEPYRKRYWLEKLAQGIPGTDEFEGVPGTDEFECAPGIDESEGVPGTDGFEDVPGTDGFEGIPGDSEKRRGPQLRGGSGWGMYKG